MEEAALDVCIKTDCDGKPVKFFCFGTKRWGLCKSCLKRAKRFMDQMEMHQDPWRVNNVRH